MSKKKPQKYYRFCVKNGSGQYLATLAIIGGKMACAFTDHRPDAINVETKKRASILSELCNAGGCSTLPTPYI